MGDNFAQREVSRNVHIRAAGLKSSRRSRHALPMPTSYHIHLKAHRKAKGLSQEQVANILGVKNNTISGWETGARTLDLEDLEKLAKIYGVHPSALLMAPEQGQLASDMRRAAEVARKLAPDAAAEWISVGERMAPKTED
ncbi:helix-turn-helix domain-containing protein [Roseomonas mucosa]|uniref:helix-turn-helix domain-containing protein n=1 Tax=Roseomonas mucosa TaxID=207340 RepID=UPI0037CA9F70